MSKPQYLKIANFTGKFTRFATHDAYPCTVQPINADSPARSSLEPRFSKYRSLRYFDKGVGEVLPKGREIKLSCRACGVRHCREAVEKSWLLFHPFFWIVLLL